MIRYLTVVAMSSLMIEEGPVGGLGLRRRITGGLAAMILYLAVVAMIHYL